jgi:hypothetical protein
MRRRRSNSIAYIGADRQYCSGVLSKALLHLDMLGRGGLRILEGVAYSETVQLADGEKSRAQRGNLCMSYCVMTYPGEETLGA